MNWNEATRSGLGVALNEADLVGLAFDLATRTAVVTLLVPTLAAAEPQRAREVQLLLHPVARVAASLRGGAWNDRSAPVVPQRLQDLPATVRSFGGQPIYGFEFVDVHERELAQWGDRLSLDWRGGGRDGEHSLFLFQEGVSRHLDLCLWFDDLEILDGRGMRVRVEDFLAGGRDWWRAFRAGDQRAQGHGLVPLVARDTMGRSPSAR